MYDWLIVGAGFAGSVLAERIASQRGERVMVIDRRPHIGGNAYDQRDAAGVLMHRYGPHIFHTNSKQIFDHLSRFTRWRPYEHRVLGEVRSPVTGQPMLVPVPINLDTINRLYGLSLTESEVEAWMAARSERVPEIRSSEDVVVSKVGRELYELFFRGYTRKQWALDPSELDKSVTARVPTRTNRDDRYFTDTYQAMPLEGYTRMFERLLAHSPRVKVLLQADYREVRSQVNSKKLIYTGAIDEYYDYLAGVLPYRSLRFQAESFTPEQLVERASVSGKKGFWQPAVQVNYPNEFDFTRIVEAKHITGQRCENTTIVREYPADYVRGGEAYYPVPNAASKRLYEDYAAIAALDPDVHFVGRLATYRYTNMDETVDAALNAFEEIKHDWLATAAHRSVA